MSVRLAHDNVHPMPSGFIPNIVAALRAYADLIEDGEIDVRKLILVSLDDEYAVDFAAFGEPFDSAQGVGYLEMAKAKMIEGSWRK